MQNFKQPSLFISHGTMYEAFKSEQLKKDFQKLRAKYLKILPKAIIIFSGHWQTENIKVTTNPIMQQLDEGFPLEFQSDYKTNGNINLSNQIIEMLNYSGIEASAEPSRGLDHGALIPLLLLFPMDKIPVIQISQQYNLDPVFHKQVGEVLKPLRSENILFIGSGGLVHNRSEIQKFGGHEIEPDHWAKEFDDYIENELTDKLNTNYADKIISAYNHKHFFKSHPTTEHFLPLVFVSAFGGHPTKIYEAFQWKNLSVSAFIFD